jgi:hypothetical protein
MNIGIQYTRLSIMQELCWIQSGKGKDNKFIKKTWWDLKKIWDIVFPNICNQMTIESQGNACPYMLELIWIIWIQICNKILKSC